MDSVIARITARTPAPSKKQVYQAATQEFLDQAKTAITQRKHFTLETNFRDESPLSVIDEFKRFGYTINMVYLTLDLVHPNKTRRPPGAQSVKLYFSYTKSYEDFRLFYIHPLHFLRLPDRREQY